jgi:hypothetical protein
LILEQETGPSIFLGGFKSALNQEFLEHGDIDFIVCAAKDLHQKFGEKYETMIGERNDNFPNIEVHETLARLH